MTEHKSPEKQSKICVGDKVLLESETVGYVLFIGPVLSRKGYVLMYGIETGEGQGRNDGTHGGRRYFWTQPERGLIIPRKKITRILKRINGLRLTVNDRVNIEGRSQGTIRFVGPTLFGPHVWYGVELDNKIGRCNGMVNGTRYFTAKPMHGVFVREDKCVPLESLIAAGSSSSLRGINLTPSYNIKTDRIRMAQDLYQACANGDYPLASAIMRLDPSVCREAIDSQRRVTALMTASYQGFEDIVSLLLTSGSTHLDINAGNTDGMTALHMASQSGHGNIVNLLLSNGANVNDHMLDGSTPLLLATALGAISTVSALIDHNADVNKCREDGTSPLIFASSHGHDNIVRRLVNTPNININHRREHDRATALFTACRHGHANCVKELLQHNAIDINCAKLNGRSPLFIAAFFGNVEIVEMMLEYSERMQRNNKYDSYANMNQEDNKGFTPLFVASQNGHARVVDLLLRHDVFNEHGNKCDVNKSEQRGHTPLWIAALRGHVPCVKLLLSHPDIEIDATDQSGVSPLWAAAQNDNDQVVELLLHPAAVPIDYGYGSKNGQRYRVPDEDRRPGANTNLAKHDGCTPLWIACGRGNVKAVIKLLQFGAKINQRDRSQGATPLFVACQNGHEKAVQILVQSGADINIARAGDGTAPLMMASHNGHIGIARLLLTHGADATLTNRSGLTALGCAAMQGHTAVVEMIYTQLRRLHLKKDVVDLVNSFDETNGWTALHLAAMSGHEEVVDYLVNIAHAEVHQRDTEGHNALWHARDQGHENLATKIEHLMTKFPDTTRK